MRFRHPGLQAWLVATLIAVGALASAAVLLTVLPTLETNLRRDEARTQGGELLSAIDGRVRNASLESAPEARVAELATAIAAETGGQVRIIVIHAGYRTVARSPGCCRLLDAVLGAANTNGVANSGTAGGYRYVWARQRYTFSAPIFGEGVVVEAAARSRGVSDSQLNALRRRLIVAVAAVLMLAALAGYGLSRLVGKRIAVLARTASRLAAGDLGARAPDQRLLEFSILGESLNTMAGRIENQVDQITGERDRAGMLISSLAEGVIGLDDDGAITIMNPAAKRLLGVPPGAVLNRSAELPPALVQAIEDADPADGDPLPQEVTLDDGTELEFILARLAAPAAGAVVTMRDVTEQRRLERARRDLVANVSHELKTPLAAIKGLLELLQGPRIDPGRREEFLELMSGEADRLQRLVEEQLQLARLDSGGLPLERERFDLDAMAEGVVASRQALAEADGRRLRAVVSAGPVPVHADPARVEQILLILLDNALRHTPAGGSVDVVVGRDGPMATMAVVDTGEGIPLQDQPFVFDRFYRGDRSREGRSAGLGLAIARGLARAHGGAIDLASAPGAGSTFTLRLPAAAPPTQEHPVIATPPSPGDSVGG